MNFKQYIENDTKIHLLSDVEVSESMRYHIEKGINIHENVFRAHSKSYVDLVEEARDLYERDQIALGDEDVEFLETDIGLFGEYKGRRVLLDAPFVLKSRLDEAEYHGKKVKTGKPFRTPGENKKFAVYVKTPSGRVKKVRFGDPKLSVKNNSPARAKSFRARHKCSEKKDRTKAGYWACRIGRYAKSVGLSSSRPW
jgi:hypothetical protein